MEAWQKEYLGVLEKLESSNEPRITFHYEGNERIGVLLKELADALLVDATFYVGPLAEASITYKGRLELDRLRSLRPWDKFLSYAGSAVIFAAGALMTKIMDWIFSAKC